jgi:pectate lyase
MNNIISLIYQLKININFTFVNYIKIYIVKIILPILCYILFGAAYADNNLLAFPSAEGFGAIAVGGRGGRIIKVTNLNGEGPGSLQAAASAKGPRIIIFEVGGVIRGDIEIKDSNITIAGQTAPTPGITIVGRIFAHPENNQRLHDIIIRFLRIRPPPTTGVNGDAIQLPNTERVILDHLSLAWANDEMIDIIYSSDVTIQWCTIEESDTEGHAKGVQHNYAILSAYPKSGNISIHHNLFAHHRRRLPSLSPYESERPGDFRNNVIYNFYEGMGHDGHRPKSAINLVGNYYKRGPSAEIILLFNFTDEGRYFLKDNYIEGFGVIHSPQEIGFLDSLWLKVNSKGILLSQPANTAQVTTTSAGQAFVQVLRAAGSFPRDRVTVRTIKEVSNGYGRWGRNAPADPDNEWFLEGLNSEKQPKDSDGDGIPDVWEDRLKTNKLDGTDYLTLTGSGYSAIEQYINIRAELLLDKNAK